jgi:hypothetical protein
MPVSEAGRERQTNNPVNDARRDEKQMRQRAFADAMIEQYKGEREYLGVFKTLKELGIPWGTYCTWLGSGDEDWARENERVKIARRFAFGNLVERAIIGDGEGLNRVAYAQGMLNRLDPDLRDRIEHSGNIGNVTLAVDGGLGSPPIVSRARTETPAEPEPTPTQDKGQG